MSDETSVHKIVDYYDTCETDYRLIWNLENSLAMHFGYWDKTVGSFAQALEAENRLLAEKAKICPTDLVLDAGCGVGGSSIFLAKHYGCKTVGITLSEKQARQASLYANRKGVGGKTDFLVMDFENLAFPNKKFDVVWAIESVCHAKSKKKFIEEAFRVLKPGGRLIVADGFQNSKLNKSSDQQIMHHWLSGWSIDSLETKQNFQKFLSNAGFKSVSFLDATKNIMPSSLRMYRYSLLAIVYGKIAETLGRRSRTQTKNIFGAYFQYRALKRNLWQYGLFFAQK